MPFVLLVLVLVMQVTPPPPPPLLVTPQPSPSATPSASPAVSPPASPSASPSATPMTIAGAPVNLHPAESKTLPIQNGVGPFTTSVDTPLVTATIDQNARTLTVTAAQQTGRATVTVNDSTGAAVQVPVRVALDAGSVPASVSLRITGTQIDTQWLTLQMQKVLQRFAQVQAGATLQVNAFTLPPALGPGATAAVPVPVHIAGGDQYFDVDAWTTVNVQNVQADPFTPPLLLYDDDPEKINAPGVLFRGQVQPNVPARLYFYHENTGEPRTLAVVLNAASAQPSTLQLIDSSAGPNIDVMTVGHTVSRNFLLQKPLNEGVVVDVDPQTPYVAEQFAMNPLDGAAGNVGIRVLDGGPVTVTVIAAPPGATQAQIAQYLAQPQLPDDGHHRTGVFSLTNYASEAIPYTAPGPDANVQYGAHTPPLADPANAGQPPSHDYGEYGVLRSMNFAIYNPQDQAQTLYLYERPLGGPVRSSFLVNGVLAQVGCARVSDRYQIGDAITVA
ncbi:MAG TPA: hypothetical protein VFH72_15005, partial [Candidatus Baltobacteraceae bacterium]|nr:hypothetical protein [Candidatus Baltobacteraceae bacterium]